jgi:PEP-CTERM motif
MKITKQLVAAVVGAALSLSAATVQAQGLVISFKREAGLSGLRNVTANDLADTPSNTVNGNAVNESGGGGFAFKATAPNALNLDKVTAFCIDPAPGLLGEGVAMAYRVLTFNEFVTWTSGNRAGGYGTYSTMTTNDLANMAQRASSYTRYTASQTVAIGNANGELQNQIWRIAKGDVNPVALSNALNTMYATNWRVMVDNRYFLTAPVPGDVYQPQLVQVSTVPEPSTYALMAFGLAGLGAVSRRRNRKLVLATRVVS